MQRHTLKSGSSGQQGPIVTQQYSQQSKQLQGYHCKRIQKPQQQPSCRFTATNAAATSFMGCHMKGCGSSVPETVLSNNDLKRLIDTDDDWIIQRTGIRRRHVLGANENLSTHAIQAAQKALDMAGVAAQDIDLIILATSSPDDTFGSACQIQSGLGCTQATCFDLSAACSGFVMALTTAAQFIRTGAKRNVLVIGADCLSRYVDWTDRRTCILFGDGAGAVVLSATSDPCCLLGYDMNSDGTGRKHLYTNYTGPEQKAQSEPESAGQDPSYGNIQMNGQEVFKFAVRKVPSTLEASLTSADIAIADVDWLLLHQANQRILDAVAKRMKVPKERVLSNLGEYGNTSAATIPLVLDENVRSGKIKGNDVCAMAGFGAGLTWASAIVRWGGDT